MADEGRRRDGGGPVSETVTYPGARRPARSRTVDAFGLALAVYEWGAEDAPPLLLAHGGFDFAGTFDGFAPLLADGGWRVVSWDARGCGDSEHAALYAWSADVRDALAVLDTVADTPIPFVGHSKGGGIMLQLAESCPHRVSHFVVIDGLPSPRLDPDVADHQRTRLLGREISGWLDHRRRAATNERKPDTLDGLAARRARMNPRLPMDWLRYLVSIGGREDADGWRWKIDPALRPGGFGPWRPSWSLERLPGLQRADARHDGASARSHGVGRDARDDQALPAPRRAARGVRGHWPLHSHRRPPRCRRSHARLPLVIPLVHGRITLALHELRGGSGRSLLLLHGLGERTPTHVPPTVASWRGPIFGLDFTGHGDSTIPSGGGYYAEVLMGDVDAALAHLGAATVYGRGLGAYLALLIAGSRCELVHGTILGDGPGLAGGGSTPGSPFIVLPPAAPVVPPDPFALVELASDVRPPDYATAFARQATHGSQLDEPIAVSARGRPEWLAAVAAEPGVRVCSLDEALTLYS